MKRMITTAAVLAGAMISLNAMTPSERIAQMRNRMEIHRKQTHTPTYHRTGWHHHIAVSRTAASATHAPATQADRRTFYSRAQYRRIHHRTRPTHESRPHTARRTPSKHRIGEKTKKLGHYVGNGWFVDDRGQYDEAYVTPGRDPYRWVPSLPHRQHAYPHYRRQWYLTYRYTHAAFDDQYGYHYGYFDRHGFVFDGGYYCYDRAYTYQDRLHGKGLFEHRFYRPIRADVRVRYHQDAWGDLDGIHAAYDWKF